MQASDELFSDDYRTARKRFRAAAKEAGMQLHRLYWGMRGPDGEKLAIDIAVAGSLKKAKRVLFHSSGIHGVEGFAGSAVQLSLAERPPELPEDGALILAHGMNPYGMANLRRVNESNVDLNRNFLHREEWSDAGAHEGYHVLHGLLNPETHSGLKFFTPRLLWKAARHGFDYLKQAGAEGQYLYPRGLFFGGTGLESGPQLFLKWIKKRLKSVQELCALDVHTGVGEAGRDWLILERGHGGELHGVLREEYRGPRLDDDNSIIYQTRGGLDAGMQLALRKRKTVKLSFITQEFGACGGRALLNALRRENLETRHGNADPSHPSRIELRDCFSPRDAGWRRNVIAGGRALVEHTARTLFAGKKRTRPEI